MSTFDQERLDSIDDRIKEQLSRRDDIFKHLVPENPFLRAAESLLMARFILDDYNQAVHELHRLGFHQFPTIDHMDGSNDVEPGMMTVSTSNVLELLTQGPVKQSLYIREQEVSCERQRERDISRSEKQKRQPDPVQSLISRLGYEPEEWVCVYCRQSGVPGTGPDGRVWHVDHFYPKSAGGDDHRDNKVLSCATCNLSKGARPAIALLAKQGVLGG